MQEKDVAAFFEVIRSRRSVRAFKPTPVPKEHILQILDAARLAPTSGNQQPWKFLVIQDRAMLDQLQKESIAATLQAYQEHLNLSPEEAESHRAKVTQYCEGFLSAPIYVVVLVDKESKYPDYNVHDGPLAAANLMLAARALGYGTVYGTDAVSVEALRRIWAIPERFEITCIIPIGVPVEWPAPPPKKKLEELIIYERFK